MNQMETEKAHENFTPEFVEKRNKRLEKFFRDNGFDCYDIRIIGNENKPAILYQDTFILPCYVHNFELRWTDKHYDGNIIKTYKLTTHSPQVREEIQNLIQNGDLKRVYKVSSTNANLFLIGWNYLDRENKALRFPVFGRFTPKVYYKTEKAEEIVEELQREGYSCRIV